MPLIWWFVKWRNENKCIRRKQMVACSFLEIDTRNILCHPLTQRLLDTKCCTVCVFLHVGGCRHRTWKCRNWNNQCDCWGVRFFPALDNTCASVWTTNSTWWRMCCKMFFSALLYVCRMSDHQTSFFYNIIYSTIFQDYTK